MSQIQHVIQQTAIEPLSDNQTEYDVQEAEDIMNKVPSPTHRQYTFWSPEYEARRQARKPFRSPPLTPDPEEPWKHSCSLQSNPDLSKHHQHYPPKSRDFEAFGVSCGRTAEE